jgi:putative glutamine amidotransferase
MRKIIIGITYCSKYEAYADWIEKIENVEALKLSYHDNNFKDIDKCDGLVLSGGEDVHPRHYKKSEFIERYKLDDVDEQRDAFELKVLDYSQKKQVPLLGICRGLQVANVFFGGTLIPDIPSFGKFNHAKEPEYDRYHFVHVDRNSYLSSLVASETGEVNSAHHQSADQVGEGLVANAISYDGVIEGLERLHPEGKSFLLLVQWHPERMNDQNNPLTKNVRAAFIDSVRKAISI